MPEKNQALLINGHSKGLNRFTSYIVILLFPASLNSKFIPDKICLVIFFLQ